MFGLVWFGLVWFGLDLVGLVWFGLEFGFEFCFVFAFVLFLLCCVVFCFVLFVTPRVARLTLQTRKLWSVATDRKLPLICPNVKNPQK